MRAADDLTLEGFRCARRRLRRLDRLAALIGYGFLVYVLYEMTLGRHVDAFYLAPFCFGGGRERGAEHSDLEPATWPLDAIAKRVRGRAHWGRIVFYVGLAWGLAFVATVVVVLLYVPETERL